MSAPTTGSIFGLSHVDVPVTDLQRAARFYELTFGFSRKQAGAGWIDLDAHSIAIRLVEVASERRATLRVLVADPARVVRAVEQAGGQVLYATHRTGDQELVASAHDPDGNAIHLWRALTEDEYEQPPELPVEIEWSPESVTLLKSLLLAVPALFRGLARRKVVRTVEEAVGRGRVGELDVVRGYIASSAKITRGRLRAPLARHGYDPDAFQAEFDAD